MRALFALALPEYVKPTHTKDVPKLKEDAQSPGCCAFKTPRSCYRLRARAHCTLTLLFIIVLLSDYFVEFLGSITHLVQLDHPALGLLQTATHYRAAVPQSYCVL